MGFCFFLISFIAQAQNCPLCASLEVKVTGIKSDKGVLRIFLTANKENFEQSNPKKINLSKAFFRNSSAKVSGVVFRFDKLNAGDYAFKVFHDENSNEMLDTSLLGKPLEGFIMSMMKSPLAKDIRSNLYNFEKAKFKLSPTQKTKIETQLLYL